MIKQNRVIRLGASKVSWIGIFAIILLQLIADLAWAQSQPSAFTVGYRFDAASRRVGVIRPDPDGDGPLRYAATRTVYDNRGQVERVESGELKDWQSESTLPVNWVNFSVHSVVVYTYDDFGRKTSEKQISGSETFGLTEFSYDSAGRLLCTAQRMNRATFSDPLSDACTLKAEGTDGPDRIQRMNYDELSRIVSIEKGFGTPEKIQFVKYSYYQSGPLESETDANGNVSYYAYDGLVRKKRWYFPSKTTKGVYDVNDFEEYGYDANDNRNKLRKRDGRVIGFEFDNLNRVISETYPVGSGVIGSTYFGYDLDSRQLYARYGSHTGKGLTQVYDTFGRLTSSTNNQGAVTRKLNYLYDLEGNRTEITFPDSVKFTFGYDGLNRVSSISEGTSATPTLALVYNAKGKRQSIFRQTSGASTAYGYDAVARLSSLNHDYSGTSQDDVRSYSFNSANQIASRTLNNSLYSFIDVPSIKASYIVNGLNQYTNISGGTSVSPLYDANGNMTWDGASTFTYDVLNRMTGVSGARTGVLVYDPKGRLFESTNASNVKTQYLYDGDHLVAEYDSSGNLLKRYIGIPGSDVPLIGYDGSSVSAATRRFYHYDHQESLVASSSDAGIALHANVYDPYGIPGLSNTGRYQFTGQIYLPEFGLYHYKARAYNPRLGRFMQTDPVGYKADQDLYTYVNNDPLNMKDPDGKIPLLIVIPFALKALDAAMTAAEIYTAAQTGGASAVVGTIAQNVLSNLVPGGKTVVKLTDVVIKEVKIAERVVGEVSKKTSKIDRAAFNKERAAFWKREAEANPSKYGPEDLTKMEKGKAPIGSDGHPMELHHKDRTMEGGVEPMTRTEHRLGENYKKNHPD